MLWVGGAQGAGKTTWSWQQSRAYDLPLHTIDLWTYDHQARLPAGDSLDGQLARGPEAAADAFESASGSGFRRSPTGPRSRPPPSRHENRAAAAGQAVDGRRRAHRGAFLPVRVRMRDERVPRYLDGHVPRLRGPNR